MNRESDLAEPMVEEKESVIRFPAGLLGFENIKEYVLLADPGEAPFAWLQMTQAPKYSFLVISPAYVSEEYNPDVSDEDVEALGITGPEDTLVLNIVTLHKDGAATANLKGPILVNRKTLVGKQVVPVNAADYAIQHPLNVTKG